MPDLDKYKEIIESKPNQALAQYYRRLFKRMVDEKNLNKVENERSRVTNLITTILVIGALLLMIIFGYKLLNDIEKKVKEKRARQHGNNVDIDIEVEEKKGLLDDAADSI